MNILIEPAFLKGTLQIPSSKSYMQRACAAALLKTGRTTIHNIGTSNDDKAVTNAIQQLGATVVVHNNSLFIDSSFNGTTAVSSINLAESGLGLRMLTPIVALLDNEIKLNGHGSLTKRPMHFFDEVLPQLNVSFKSDNGYLPFAVKGPLKPNNVNIDGRLSSQFLTGLLMAYSYANESATIAVQNLASKPYIDITLDVLKEFGLNMPENKSYNEFVFTTKKNPLPNDLEYTIESDWSSASFLLVGSAINGNCIFTGLNINSVQADIKILEALQQAKVTMVIKNNTIAIEKSEVHPFQFDATDCPDLFPPLVALAANADGITTIKGLKRLAHKESNRGVTLQKEFAKLNITIDLNEDTMIIHGKKNIKILDSLCNSHNDHRIAMALAVAVLCADKSITIEQAEAVGKSYPNFFKDLFYLSQNS